MHATYKIFQAFVRKAGLWEEFKKKTETNYKDCKMSVYSYYCMIDRTPDTDLASLIDNAFPYAQVRYSADHPDHVWANLHSDWITYLRQLDGKSE